MASQAQIDANRRNSQRSTGPKTEAGKARARLNALKDGTHARTVSRVLPHENAIELDARINKWINDLKPRNDVELELVKSAANLSWELERARRCQTARLAERVRKAQLKADERRMKEVGELARRLLYNTGAKTLPTSGRPWEDNPAAFLKGLEKSAEGCRWLLDRWAGLRVLLDRDSAWTFGDMFCLIRLLGKYPIEAINDPELNAIFLAWDAVVPGRAERFWKECKQCRPLQDPGFSDFGRWREIADRPADAAAAIKFFETLMDEQMARLEELLELHEEIAGDEAVELADRVSSDSSARGERLRREQTALGREFRQTLEVLMKMRKGENNDQVAGDGGKVKAGESPATETPAPATAPKLATPSEEKREPGSASRPASQKPKRDKYRSMAALEMVMSERLDEQGFEKFFADPPAALVVLKGLRKLAELKVPPGLAPVRGSGAVESAATSLIGMEKSRIEANGDETQRHKGQDDKSHASDSGGENRSHFEDRSNVAREP
ncbi:MAG TPA: hypothetical protein VGY53_13500 [Isosphaeraceae bacterium]|nr:hypothetical protein [Isosphaeraceae bacterium]